RIVMGELGLQVGAVALAQTIEAAIEALRPAAEARSIYVECVLDRSVTPISGDEARLRQVVWNLLSNAIKFTPRGGRIEVRLERADSWAQITVKDTGRGIKPGFLPHVFERFRQADSTSTRAHGGLGLGLAIVRHLVELHGGTVQAESAGPGAGSSFIVRLPLSMPAEADAPAETTPEVSADPDVRLDGVRVMVVEDENDVRDFLRVSLVQYGADVRTFATTAEALDAV